MGKWNTWGVSSADTAFCMSFSFLQDNAWMVSLYQQRSKVIKLKPAAICNLVIVNHLCRVTLSVKIILMNVTDDVNWFIIITGNPPPSHSPHLCQFTPISSTVLPNGTFMWKLFNLISHVTHDEHSGLLLCFWKYMFDRLTLKQLKYINVIILKMLYY